MHAPPPGCCGMVSRLDRGEKCVAARSTALHVRGVGEVWYVGLRCAAGSVATRHAKS